LGGGPDRKGQIGGGGEARVSKQRGGGAAGGTCHGGASSGGGTPRPGIDAKGTKTSRGLFISQKFAIQAGGCGGGTAELGARHLGSVTSVARSFSRLGGNHTRPPWRLNRALGGPMVGGRIFPPSHKKIKKARAAWCVSVGLVFDDENGGPCESSLRFRLHRGEKGAPHPPGRNSARGGKTRNCRWGGGRKRGGFGGGGGTRSGGPGVRFEKPAPGQIHTLSKNGGGN